MDLFNKLPEGCIAHVLSLTSPQDACRLSLVASTFRSAADSDAVWRAFLPPDHKDLIARALLPFSPAPLTLSLTTAKGLFFHLADNPLIIDAGTKSFSLEKRSGRKCYMLSARDLTIVWSDSPMYWTFTSLPESRFPEVAELISVCWLEIHGKLSTKLLSPNTLYGAYLVFKLRSDSYGMDYHPGEVSCGATGAAYRTTQTVFLDHRRRTTSFTGGNDRLATRYPGRFRILHRNFTSLVRRQFSFNNSNSGEEEEDQVQEDRITGHMNQQQQHQPRMRRDGWMEIKMGEYLNGQGCDDCDLEMSFMEVKGGNWKGGLIVEGIEIRPVQV